MTKKQHFKPARWRCSSLVSTTKKHFKPAGWRCSSRSLLCCLSRQFLQHQAWQCVVRQTIRTEQLSTLNEGKMTLCVLSYCTHSRTWSNHSTARMTLMLTSPQCPQPGWPSCWPVNSVQALTAVTAMSLHLIIPWPRPPTTSHAETSLITGHRTRLTDGSIC